MSFPNPASSALSDAAGSVLRSLHALPVRIEILDPHLVSAVCDLQIADAAQALRHLADAGLAESTRSATKHLAAEYRLCPKAPESAHSPIPNVVCQVANRLGRRLKVSLLRVGGVGPVQPSGAFPAALQRSRTVRPGFLYRSVSRSTAFQITASRRADVTALPHRS